MKHIHSFLSVCLAAAMAACGGSSNSGTGTPPSNITNTVQIEAQLVPSSSVLPLNQTGPSGCVFTYNYIDSTQFEVGDSFQFVLASYNSQGVRTQLAAQGWITSDTSNIYGPVSYDTGIFASSGAETKSAQQIAVTYNGQTYRASYDVLPHQARVRGQILAHDTFKPLAGVEVDFYGPNSSTDSSIVLRGKALTQSDGTFQASVPAPTSLSSFEPTQFFTINNATLPSGYQSFFEYGSTVYETGSLSCLATIDVPGKSTAMELAAGNNDMIGITSCSGSKPSPKLYPTNGWILLYSGNEKTPTANGCQS